MDVSHDFEHLNGDYAVEVLAADINALKPDSWSLGKLSLWFKNGLDEGSNNGVRAEYQPKDIIKHIFPPEEEEGNIIVFSHF